nr:NADH-plastoquinone oxidoreductase subunit I [Sanicula orthacantha var. stolonifera]
MNFYGYYYLFNKFDLLIRVDFLLRYIAETIASPIAASAAAIAITKMEKMAPFNGRLSKKSENVTKLILTAFKISSRHIRALTIFRLVINPKRPIENKEALKTSTCSSIIKKLLINLDSFQYEQKFNRLDWLEYNKYGTKEYIGNRSNLRIYMNSKKMKGNECDNPEQRLIWIPSSKYLLLTSYSNCTYNETKRIIEMSSNGRKKSVDR